MSVLLWTISILLAVALVAAIVVAVAPLAFAASVSYRNEELHYSARFWWLHRALVHGVYTDGSDELTVRVLAWTFRVPVTEEEEAPVAAEPAAPPAEPVKTTALPSREPPGKPQ